MNGPQGETDTGSNAKKAKNSDDTSTLQPQATSMAKDTPIEKPGDGTVQTNVPDKVPGPQMTKLIGGLTQRQAWLSQGPKTYNRFRFVCLPQTLKLFIHV